MNRNGGPASSGMVARLDRNTQALRSAAKKAMYQYQRMGRGEGTRKPKKSTLLKTFNHLLPFLRYLDSLKINSLGDVTPMVCANYVAECKAERQTLRSKGKPLLASTLTSRFMAVEMLHDVSQSYSMPMPHPWPENSAKSLAGETGKTLRSKTPLIPDNVFTIMFQAAYDLVKRGGELLDMRDALDDLALIGKGKSCSFIKAARNRHLATLGWEGGYRMLTTALSELRTACYIVVASLSGCRNHELANVHTKAYYRSEDDEGEVYWWMRGRSDKTGTGKTEWMVPEAAVDALRIMDRLAVRYQVRLADEIAQRRAANPLDPEIAEAQRHVGAVFLGWDKQLEYRVRTVQVGCWGLHLKRFASRCGVDWVLSSHQFRRKFANYAARSKFGDLRYLREHFKHWSQDMTNDAYALNESQEMELYAEIQDELDTLKLGLAEQWLNPAEPLAGGYGKNLVEWRSRGENIALFKDHATMVRSVAESHAIRSNGHAWCTADDNKCIGNTFEKTRCSGCDNAVIGRFHGRLYQRLYDDLKEVAKCDDIGPGGQARVLRDMERCRDVLISLGYDPEAKAA